MQLALTIDNEDAAGRTYLTWTPTRGTLRWLDAPGQGVDPATVTLGNADPGTGGQVEFADRREGPRTATLAIDLPADGSPVPFWVAGTFGRPSTSDGDAVLSVTGTDGIAARRALMVRVRKDATTLTDDERDRFTTALALLNDSGRGLFRDFRAMHKEEAALDQAHGAPGFLPWHRAYLLDLERELQRIDPSVALPYWRFDQPAPQLFTLEFLGRTRRSTTDDGGTTVVFGPTNLLRDWHTDDGPGINRTSRFAQAAAPPGIRDEATTLAMGGPGAIFDNGRGSQFVGNQVVWEIGFDEMELAPHGQAHTRFWGSIRDATLAPRDPLFFLLHCNVDRLWALWQRLNDRFDGTKPEAYFFRGSATDDKSTRVGHNLLDTMWPYNNVTGSPRPDNAPRTPFPQVPTAPAPGLAPRVGDMIDYQGLLDPASDMNFAYDDVAYGVAA